MMFPKPSREARKKAERKRKRERVQHEVDNKDLVRRRDECCRFPLCGCRGLPLEVSHDKHKGMGGNPTGDRSATELMVLLCPKRHQNSFICRHRGTLKVDYLTDRGYDGPVVWLVDLEAYGRRYAIPVAARQWVRPDGFVQVARETNNTRVLRPLMLWQWEMLQNLSRMEY